VVLWPFARLFDEPVGNAGREGELGEEAGFVLGLGLGGGGKEGEERVYPEEGGGAEGEEDEDLGTGKALVPGVGWGGSGFWKGGRCAFGRRGSGRSGGFGFGGGFGGGFVGELLVRLKDSTTSPMKNSIIRRQREQNHEQAEHVQERIAQKKQELGGEMTDFKT
jgi:hypothetical protein